MNKAFLTLFIIILSRSIIKGVVFSLYVVDKIEEKVNNTKIKVNSSEVLKLIGDVNLKDDFEDMEQKLGGISLNDLVKQVDKKKIFHYPKDESENLLFNSLISYKSYQFLCFDNITLPVNIQSKLKCRYLDRGNPFLRIAPFKEEEAYLEPRIVIFHDVLYQEEIETLKTLAQPKLKRATEKNDDTGEEEFINYRITDIAWFRREQHEVVEAVHQRVHLMTGLSLKKAEPLQIASYPLKGKHEPHFDFDSDNPQSTHSPPQHYDRIATVLFYMNDVEEGGATVFTKLDVTLTPKMGSAAFWYNIKPNGNRDYLTLHASCPVISGKKWAANLWISEAWQELHHPCTLENQPHDAEWEQLYLV